MEKSRVALIRCDGYDEASVFRAVSDGTALLGGVSRFAAPDERILLKPNVLAGDDPNMHVSPHPSVMRAVAKLFHGRTSRLTYGDSPGIGRPETALRKAGLAAAAEEGGAVPANFTDGREVRFPRSPFTRSFRLAEGVLSSDGIVSISKLKSHAFMRMTGAVKNQFGCVLGLHKAAFHLKLPDPADFGRMLAALTLCLKPRLYVMDGIVAMQGNGPRGGIPCPMNVLLFSEDPVALDAVMCRLVALDPGVLATNPPGRLWGLGTYLADEIELVGDAIDPLIKGDFDVNRVKENRRLPPAVGFLFNNMVSARPVIIEKRCTRCGTCVQICPVSPKAVDWRGGSHGRPPRHFYGRCIRCYCCQEVCPEKAIEVRAGLFRA